VKPQWERRHWLLAVAVAGPVAWLLAFAIFWRSLPPVPEGPEDRSYPRRPEEERVAAFILGASQKPEAVQFLRWGPHMPANELASLFRESGVWQLHPWMLQGMPGPLYIVRVCFTDPNDRGLLAPYGDGFAEPLRAPGIVHDRLYILFDQEVHPLQKVHPLQNNLAGDQWKQDAQQKVGQLAMSINAIPGRVRR
jgi:hypothetical protein